MNGILLMVLAFSDPGAFLAPAELGGGNGNHFTGSPRSHFDCSVCHDASPALSLEVRSDPDGLFTGGYRPGATYSLTFTISDKGKVAGFGAEVNARSGRPAGELSTVTAAGEFLCLDGPNDTPGSDPVQVFADPDGTPGVVVAALACKNSPRSWKASWKAPEVDVGLVTLYASAVAGDLDGSNRGDRVTSRVLGIPSPASLATRSTSCSTAPGFSMLALLFVVFLCGRRRAVWLVVLLVPLLATAAPKKKKAPKAPVQQKVPTPIPPAPAKVEPEPPVEPSPAPVTRAVEPVPAPPTIAPAVPVTPSEEFNGAAHAGIDVGFGQRELRLTSASFASPLHAVLPFPMVSMRLGFHPMRPLRTHVLEGLEVEAVYMRGWVLGPVPLGGAQVLPADGWLTLGYELPLGAFTLAPRALYRVQVGGAEKNFSFDDVFDQSVGGELKLQLRLGPLSVLLVPRASVVLDTGTLAVEGYGAQRQGLSLGGQAAVEIEVGSGFTLGASYAFTRTTVGWAGHGNRSLDAVASVDVTQQGALTLRYTR